MKRKRPTATESTATGRCEVCGESWSGPNAQAVAARHTDSRGHRTYVEVTMKIVYGEAADQPALW